MMKSFAKPTAKPTTAPKVNSKVTPSKKKGGKTEDAQEVAGFLLSLKNQRSVSPDPNDPQAAPAAATAPVSQQPPMMGYGAPVMHSYMAHPAFPYPYPMGHPMPPPGATGSVPPKQKKGRTTNKDKKAQVLKDAPNTTATSITEISTGTVEQFKEYNLEELIEDFVLVQMKDRDLVPDALFVAMSQMKICHLTQADRVGCYKSRDLGFVGMCCKHCGGQPGFGRYFPNSVRSLAQTTTSQTILKHIGNKCRFCPAEIRAAVLDLQSQQAAREGLATGRPRYGSRKIFFQRVWSRLHAGTLGKDEGEEGSKSDETASLQEEAISISEIIAAVERASPEIAAVAAAIEAEEDEEEPEEKDGVAGDDKASKRKTRALPIMSKNSKRMKISEVVLHNVKAV